MKIALYVDNETTQIVLTPEGRNEYALLDMLAKGQHDIDVVKGQFYTTRGGWVANAHEGYASVTDATMIVLHRKPLSEKQEVRGTQ